METVKPHNEATILKKMISKLNDLTQEMMLAFEVKDVDQLNQLSLDREKVLNIIGILKNSPNFEPMLESNLDHMLREQELLLTSLIDLKQSLKLELEQVRRTKQNISKYNLNSLK